MKRKLANFCSHDRKAERKYSDVSPVRNDGRWGNGEMRQCKSKPQMQQELEVTTLIHNKSFTIGMLLSALL